MAAVLNRSRRRLAAVTFLSNISLDGSYKDTKFGSLARNNNGTIINVAKGPASSITYEEEEESDDFSESELERKKKLIDQEEEEEDESTNSDSDSVVGLNKKTNKKFTHKSYRNRVNSSDSSERKATSLKIPSRGRQISGCSEFCGSSSESLDPIKLRNSPSPGLIVQEQIVTKKNKVRILKPTEHSRFNNNERIFMVTAKNIPFMVCSFIPYKKSKAPDFKREEKRKRTTSGTMRPLSAIGDALDPFDSLGIERAFEGQEVSFGFLLTPSHNKRANNTIEEISSVKKPNQHIVAKTKVINWKPEHTWCLSSYELMGTQSLPTDLKEEPSTTSINSVYHPHLLDDPELIAGKHRTLLTFASYMTSVIDYVKPSDLKKEINDKFKSRFPNIQLTLSKLRSIKREMRKIVKQQDSSIDLLTVAYGYVYFEKLILRGLINKQNRKLCAGASLILAAKLTDIKGDQLKMLIEKTENIFRVSRKDLLAFEIAVLVALEFGLHVPIWEVTLHYQRLIYES